jgi:hypothetical protein
VISLHGEVRRGRVQRVHTVNQDAAAHQEHGHGAEDTEQAHQAWRQGQEAATQQAQQGTRGATALALYEIQAGVIQLDDARHQTVHADGHHQGNRRQHRGTHREAGISDNTQGK